MLAATSRPDLLDAALLRPGRLDRLIYCGFPTAAERGQILQALARRLSLPAKVDLNHIGRQCEGYSGADLSALLSEAQLVAVHERLDLDTAGVSIGETSQITCLRCPFCVLVTKLLSWMLLAPGFRRKCTIRLFCVDGFGLCEQRCRTGHCKTCLAVTLNPALQHAFAHTCQHVCWAITSACVPAQGGTLCRRTQERQ